MAKIAMLFAFAMSIMHTYYSSILVENCLTKNLFFTWIQAKIIDKMTCMTTTECAKLMKD